MNYIYSYNNNYTNLIKLKNHHLVQNVDNYDISFLQLKTELYRNRGIKIP